MLTPRDCFRIDGYYAGRDYLDYQIKDDDKVLDIGGGCKPFRYATHVLDSSCEEFDAQRYDGAISLLEGQVLIDGTTDDLHQFEDNEFDFIYTSHILEHIKELPQALEEISRVGKRGFVAVPAAWYDFWSVRCDVGHEWFCEYDYVQNQLLIRKRGEHDYVDFMADMWSDVMWGPTEEDWKRTEPWRRAWEGHYCVNIRPFWEIRFFWYEQIDYRVDDTVLPQLNLFRLMILQALKDKEEGKLMVMGEPNEEAQDTDSDTSEEGVEEGTF